MKKNHKMIKSRLGIFSKILNIRRRICDNIIIKLDRIISKCADKRQKEEIDNKLNDLEDFQRFSQVFNENKSLLQDGINDLKLTNEYYKETLELIFIHFDSGDYQEVKRIFIKLGFTQNNNIKK